MTATNVTIDNLVDYSNQLSNLSYLSNLSNISSQLTTLNNNLVTLIGYIDGLETLQSNLITAVNQLTAATQVISTSSVKLANSLVDVANTASMSYNFTVENYYEDTYFKREPAEPEIKIKAIWTGTVSTIYLNTSKFSSRISPGFRVEGPNIDVNTFITSVNGVNVGINKPTLGSVPVLTTLKFYRT